MSLKQPYEIIIADKLQQLPVPDMADAIWARIELELDASANEDANEPAKPAHPNGKGVATKTIAIIGGGLLALVVLFFIVMKNNKRTKDKKTLPTTEKVVTLKQQQSLPAPPSDTARYFQPKLPLNTGIMPTDSPASRIDPITLKGDEFQLPLFSPQRESAASLNIAPRTESSIDSSLLQTVPKKPRGIQIPDNDYRIQGSKKDTAKKSE